MRSKNVINRENLRTSLLMGLGIATVLSAYVAIVHRVQGPHALQKNGVTLQGAVLAYYSAGALGGLIVGALWRIAGSFLGSIVIGMIVGVLIYGSMQVAVAGPFWQWSSTGWADVFMLGLPIGGISGPLARRLWRF